MDELTGVSETQQIQQAAGVEEVVVGVEDPLQISDTEQGDIALETQQDLDSSGFGFKGKGKGKSMTREGQYVSEEKADKRGEKAAVLFSAENEQKLVDFLRDSEILYNKRLKHYKDRSKREAVWDQFCENNLDKDSCQKWFQSHSHEVGPGGPQLTEWQTWTRDNFDFLRDHVRHLKGKSEFRAPKGSASQASAAVGSASRTETVHMEPFQDTSRPESTNDQADMSHLDTDTPTPRSCGVKVTSSLADSDLNSALVESQRG